MLEKAAIDVAKRNVGGSFPFLASNYQEAAGAQV